MDLELQHRLVRQAIDIAVSKAIEDMKSNSKRSIRNLIDLGLMFSTSSEQTEFFIAAQKMLATPRNPYYQLVSKMLAEVDNDTVKKVGLNLGYSSLIHGAGKLKKWQVDLGVPIPWLLVFDSESDALPIGQLERCVREGMDLGIYSYIVCPHGAADIAVSCDIARQFDECLFLIKTRPGLIDGAAAASIEGVHNAAVSVQVSGEGFQRAESLDAFRLLKERRCLYGFHVYYDDENAHQVATPAYIRSAIELGNRFGAYIAGHGVSDACGEAVFSFVRRARSGCGQSLIAFELNRDVKFISAKILSGRAYLPFYLAGKAFEEYKKAKGSLANALIGLFQSAQFHAFSQALS